MTPTAAPNDPCIPARVRIQLPDGRTVYVRDSGGRSDDPALVLIHGLMLTADLNWFGAFAQLASRFRVVAPDLPAGGPLARRADDVAAVASVLGLRQVVPVGYSMGGLVAQLVWRRHRPLVAGLVLCCTARNFQGTAWERLAALSLPGVAAALRLNPFLRQLGSGSLAPAVLGWVPDPGLRRWAQEELDHTSLADAAADLDEVSRFTSHEWISGVDVRTAVVITTRDQIVPAARQRRLAAAIPRAVVHELAAGHGACVTAPDRLAAVLMTAATNVATGRPEALR